MSMLWSVAIAIGVSVLMTVVTFGIIRALNRRGWDPVEGIAKVLSPNVGETAAGDALATGGA